MKLNKYIAAAFILCAINVNAEQIEIPHTFTEGTKAVASEVNENFSTIVVESNSQDSRISTLEDATVSDQLICVVFFDWPTSGSAYDCVQRSNPTNIRFLSYAHVAQEGWTAISVGGDGSNNRMIYVFSK